MSRPRKEYDCGTDQAYKAHLRRGEPTDPDCRAAHAAAWDQWRAEHMHLANATKRRWRAAGGWRAEKAAKLARARAAGGR